MGLQRFKLDVANAVVNTDNMSLSAMDTGQMLELFTADKGDKSGEKKDAGGENRGGGCGGRGGDGRAQGRAGGLGGALGREPVQGRVCLGRFHQESKQERVTIGTIMNNIASLKT